MKVHLRKKPISKNRSSLYLEYYNSGKRSFEFLKIYIHSGKRLSLHEKNHNKEALKKAKILKSEREVEIYKGVYRSSKGKINIYYLEYLKEFATEKGNYHIQAYRNMKLHLGKDKPINMIEPNTLRSFKVYLENKYKATTAKNYFNTIRMLFSHAIKEDIIKDNPCKNIPDNTVKITRRVHLTLEELKILYITPCKNENVKIAFLFACFTGLRISDVLKLKYSDISNDQISIYQTKTKDFINLPINQFIYSLINITDVGKEKNVFVLPSKTWINLVLIDWVKSAGINKHTTFHVSRHSFATIQITLGTDIYTVSKLLGHRNLETTQIYAKIVDKMKTDAINRMPFL